MGTSRSHPGEQEGLGTSPGIDLGDVGFTLLAHLGVPALVLERGGRIAFANTAAVAGVGRGELRGTHFLELVPVDRRDEAHVELTLAIGGTKTVAHVSALARTGESAGLEPVLIPIWVGDAVVGILVLAFEEPASPPKPRSPRRTMTPRQSEVLTLLAQALTTNEIAERLGLSTETVRNHIRAVLNALGARSRLEAVVIAERLGLLEPRD